MLWTLQKYIFREMGKSFLLTAVGLIVVLGLGGGVMNMIELEGCNSPADPSSNGTGFASSRLSDTADRSLVLSHGHVWSAQCGQRVRSLQERGH